MANCNYELPELLNEAIQARSELNSPTYCEDNFETITEQELCRKRLPQQKKEADQVIENLRQQMALCTLLEGTWSVTITVCYSNRVLSTGQLTIQNLDIVNVQQASLEGFLLLSNDPNTYTLFDASYDATREIPIQFYRSLANDVRDYWFGFVDASTQLPTMKGEKYIGGPGSDCWTAQKLP